jgi:FKBP-type peptidyl-prolyl cis-trans isomerase SlyD
MSSNTIHFVPRRNLLQVSRGMVVTLKYALFDTQRDELIEFRSDLVYLHGADSPVLPKLEQGVEGLVIGAKCEISLQPDEAFGLPDPRLIVREPRADFPPEALQPGASMEGHAPDGKVIMFRVTAVDATHVTLDGNHPLAGRSLKFVLEVMDIRRASSAEIEAGHAIRAG